MASFVTSPAAPKANTLVSFNASASKGIEGRGVVEYQWDFGDGTPLHTTGSALTTHVYAAVGSYTVTLRIVDDTGRFAVISNALEIAP
jgi:PKD repeat protein